MKRKKKTIKPSITIRDLALAADVSIGTVSRALKNQPGLSEETRADVLSVARKLGYDVSKLRGGKPRRILFLFNRVHASLAANQFYSVVLQGAESACRESDVSLILLSVGAGDDLARQVRRHEPDAMLTVGYFDAEMMSAMRRLELPLVVADHFDPGLHCINDDNLQGAMLATRHLLEGGARRPAMIVGPLSHYSVALRAKGFRRALFEAGRLADPDLEVSLDVLLPYDVGGREAMKKLLALPEPPDAVFAYNDQTALNAMEACAEAGIDVPGKIAFIGYDDIAAAANNRIPLSTIHVDKEELGRRAVNRLIAGDIAPGEELLPVDLVVRETSRRP